MTEAHRKFPSDLEDALYALAIAPDGPAADALDVLTRRFPAVCVRAVTVGVRLEFACGPGRGWARCLLVDEGAPGIRGGLARHEQLQQSAA
jgi:hypothetical protein